MKEAQSKARYLCIMGTNWPGASERAVRVALLRVREAVVFHFIIPGLHMERGWTISGHVSKNDDLVPLKTFALQPATQQARTANVKP